MEVTLSHKWSGFGEHNNFWLNFIQAILEDKPRAATVIAETDCQLLYLDKVRVRAATHGLLETESSHHHACFWLLSVGVCASRYVCVSLCVLPAPTTTIWCSLCVGVCTRMCVRALDGWCSSCATCLCMGVSVSAYVWASAQSLKLAKLPRKRSYGCLDIVIFAILNPN